MKTYYHGTSADNLQNILKNGLSCSESKLWNCSEDAVYLWDIEGVAESNCRDLIEDADYIEQECFNMASESGQFALNVAKDCRILVIKISLDESEVENDTSCENMEGSGAKVIYRDILPEEIKEIHISCDLSLLRGYFISLALNNQYADIEFTPLEKKIGEIFSKSEIYIEEIDELITFEKMEISNLVLC